MFTIITQQKKLFALMIESGLNGAKEWTVSPEKEVAENEKTVPDFDAIQREFEKSIRDYKNRETLSVEDKARILEAKAIADRQISWLTELSLEKEKELHRVYASIVEQTTTLLSDFQKTNTREKNTEVKSNFLRGTNLRAETINSLAASSKSSLWEILKTENLADIRTQLERAAERNKNPDWGYTFTNTMWVRNYWALVDALKELWYKADGFLDDKEVSAVFHTIRDYADTQARILSFEPKEQLQILVDFDKNGVLDSNLNFSIGEKQAAFIAYESLQWDKIDALMKNLGFENMAQFAIKMSENLYSAREQFQRVLGSYLERGFTMWELLQSEGVEKGLDRLYTQEAKNAQQIDQEIDTILNEDTRLNNELSKLWNQDDIANVKKAIRLEAVWVAMGISKAIGASFDIKAFSKGFVDSLQVGIVNGTSWIAFTKWLLDKNGWKGWVGLSNFVIPFAGIAKTFERQQELEQLFDTKIQWKFEPSIYAAGALGIGTTIGLSISKPNENDSTGIGKMVQDMNSKLDLIFDDTVPVNDKLTPAEQVIVQELRYSIALIKEQIHSPELQKQALHDLKNGYLAYYENMLMRNAAWSKITSVWIWFAWLSGYNIIPYITVWGEKISQKFHGVNARITEERSSTHRELSPELVGLERDILKGKNVYSIDESKYTYQISTQDGTAQAERKDGKLYFSWNINTLTIDEHITSQGVMRTIVINGWQTSTQWMYLWAKTQEISSNIEQNTYTDILQNSLESTKVLRGEIFNLLDTDALKSKDTPGLTALQVAIYNLRAGKGWSLESVWTNFQNTFAGFRWKYSNTMIPTMKDNLSGEEKMLILQTIPAALMKKSGLQVDTNWYVNTKWNARRYDEVSNRAQYFDTLFNKEVSTLAQAVKAAREEWYRQNTGASGYTFQSISDGSIAFSWTQVWWTAKNPRQNVLMPYTGAYNVASFVKWKEFSDIDALPAQKAAIIDTLPNTYLESLWRALDVKDINEVKNMLKTDNVSYKLAFTKMWECLNDAIVLKDLHIPWWVSLSTTLSSTVYAQENKVVQAGVIVSEQKENFKKGGPDEPTTRPIVEPDPETTPTTEVDTWWGTPWGWGTPDTQEGGR